VSHEVGHIGHRGIVIDVALTERPAAVTKTELHPMAEIVTFIRKEKD